MSYGGRGTCKSRYQQLPSSAAYLLPPTFRLALRKSATSRLTDPKTEEVPVRVWKPSRCEFGNRIHPRLVLRPHAYRCKSAVLKSLCPQRKSTAVMKNRCSRDLVLTIAGYVLA
jgi:hypothetical protein